MTSTTCIRTHVRVRGTVQGVGFRPFVYRLAVEHRLAGYVLNDEQGVRLEVEGDSAAVERFIKRLGVDAPRLAVVESVEVEAVEARGEDGFRIVESRRAGEPDAAVTPDTATCEKCLAELMDPADRRYRYPFINCTNCGPRFTIVRGIPYDRPLTTMAAFVMCGDCEREYHDPADRRFHAQPNACPSCGPRVWLHGVASADPIRELAERLRAGAIAAVKGIGGFHLACDAGNDEAVSSLRARKHREDKPFALMVRDVNQARELVDLDPASEAALGSAARPIVLAPRRRRSAVAAAVAPFVPELGIMLPYSPLHHLLLHDFGRPLVMTSGNVSDEPIAYEDGDAMTRLAGIADVFLLHDRAIHARTDDSVIRRRAIIRRSRGYVPGRIALPAEVSRPILGCGGQQKNTFCVAKGGHAWVSHHIGDLEHYASWAAFRAGVEHFERLFAVRPEIVAHDLHPDYLSTAYALEQDGLELVGVQHHHAHLAACLAEHGMIGPAVGAIFDGTGYGSDGTIWGGELLVGGVCDFTRAGWLWPVRLPGGAQAVREPWRMACAWLLEATGVTPRPTPPLARMVDERSWAAVARLARGGPNAPLTTSMGRLFDAVAALCGMRATTTYEGQAAVELESIVEPGERSAYPLPLARVQGGIVLDARETVRAIVRDIADRTSVARVAARFHNAVAEATASACVELARGHGLDTVVLSGGAFQNRWLVDRVGARVGDSGLRVLVPERLPVNDGGISFGQAVVAAARTAA